MPVHGTSNQTHQPQETMTDIRRALRMWDVLSKWDAEKDNKPNKADVTYTP